MLMTIILILGIGWIGLALFNSYVVPLFNRPAEPARVSLLVVFCGIIALLAIVLAILVGFHVIIITSGY